MIKLVEKNSWIDLNEETFPNMMSKFLFSKSGSKHQNNFKFEGILECGEPSPKIKVKIYFKTKVFFCLFR